MIRRALLTIPLLLASGTLAAEDADPPPPSPATPDPAALELASVNAAIADLESGRVLYRKNADRVVPIASITKVMTALVVLESGADLEEWLTVVEREHAAPNNAYTRLRRGSQARRGDLLRIALMSSENHAAYVLARHHPGGLSAFVEAMNDKARALGMERTRFVDPSGLSARNRSTADDLLKLVTAATANATIRRFTDTPRHTVQFRYPRYRLRYGNTNVLAYRRRWDLDLSKTGYLDEAGRCLVMVTDIEGRQVAMVLLDSFGRRTPVGDAGRIRRWLETGEGGSIAAAARRYEQRRSEQMASADPAD
ncbi:MAG: D-alanyl-D-alanine endopeptidase [Halofilum sp. (in: g-proteobacteria)]|nr:D-alanyl-D-alanine endopeptidase [Halofilum sp. (in: g-proteobacteria)]